MSDATQPMGMAELEEAARQLAHRLAETRMRLVLAESCTGGLVAATLATIPGISQWFCGSAVTYRDQTKIDWLDVSATHLVHLTAVSEEVAGEMATGVLQGTQEADLAVSITGHLGQMHRLVRRSCMVGCRATTCGTNRRPARCGTH